MLIEKGTSIPGSFISPKNCLLLLWLLIVSCSDLDRNNNSDRITLDRPWELVTLTDSSGKELELYDYEVHTLRFLNESEFAGEAACNNYGGKYVAKENGKIIVVEFYITEALCRQPSWGEEFADAITKVKKFDREDGRLILNFDKLGLLIFNERLE